MQFPEGLENTPFKKKFAQARKGRKMHFGMEQPVRA